MKTKSVLFMLDPFILPRLNGISNYAREHGWILIPDDRINATTDFSRFDGAICTLRNKSSKLETVRKLTRLEKPVVDMTIASPNVRLPRVSSDHTACGKMAVQHLLSLGISNIAWYASGASNVHRLRLKGAAEGYDGKIAELSPRNLRRSLRLLPKPLGVIAYSEADAEHVVAELTEQQINIPDEVAVIGIGNDPFLCENREVTISAVDTNLTNGAYTAAQLLDTFMDNPSLWKSSLDKTILIPPLCVVPRKTTDTLTHRDDFIRQILCYIHSHLSTPLGAQEIASHFEVARTSLDRRFRTATGHSIGTEILNQRMAKAKRLILADELPLKAIAAECGFCNQAFLSSVFKKFTGKPPSQWRESLQIS